MSTKNTKHKQTILEIIIVTSFILYIIQKKEIIIFVIKNIKYENLDMFFYQYVVLILDKKLLSKIRNKADY